MFQTLKNAWAMPELRKKILYTLFIILIFRFGSCIPVPFIDTQLLAQYFEQASTNGSMLGYLDMFSGGGLSRATIFAMSITPYINASIILQLLTVAIPALERMVKDGGEEGRKKIASWTRYVGVLLGLLQGLSYYALLRNQGFLSDKGVLAAVTIIMTFTAGTALIMWMGEHITQKGIGNGISIILFAGIVSRGPSLMRTLGNLFQTGTSGIVSAILMIIIGIFIVVFIVFMSNAEKILSCGVLVLVVVAIHNFFGMMLGLLVAKIFHVEYSRTTAIAIEVGMQNSGLAVSLAAANFAGNPLATLPGAIFSVWHNISGSIFASIRRSGAERREKAVGSRKIDFV